MLLDALREDLQGSCLERFLGLCPNLWLELNLLLDSG